MGSEWKEVTFGSIVAHSAFGPRFSSKEYAKNGNIACLRTKDISVDGRIDLGSMPLADLDKKRLANHFLAIDDLVITRTGRVGTTSVFPGFHIPVVPGAFLIRFRLSETIANPKFYQYFFNSPHGQNLIHSVATGSVQQNLNITNLNSLVINLPPLPEQKAIAHILGSLDDKIELNRRMNETLEQMAQALFQSWFVDFDPVIDKALAAGNPIPEPLQARADRREALSDRRKALPEEIAGLFPDSFVETEELGWIPAGWEVKALNSLATIKGGKRLPKGSQLTTTPNSHPYIRVRDLGQSILSDFGMEYVPDDVFSKISAYIVNYGDIVLSIVGTIGKLGMIPQSLNRASLTENCVRIRVEPNGLSPELLFAHLSSRNVQAQIDDKTVGSTQPKLPIYNIKSLQILVPKESACVVKLSAYFRPFFGHLHRNMVTIGILTSLRDTLLPKLISGELRIPEAEETVSK